MKRVAFGEFFDSLRSLRMGLGWRDVCGLPEKKAYGGESKGRPCWAYIVECQGGRLYTGITEDIPRRFNEHKAGGSRFTKAYRAERLIHSEVFPTRSQAEARDRQIKGWTRAKKLALAAGDLALLKRL